MKPPHPACKPYMDRARYARRRTCGVRDRGWKVHSGLYAARSELVEALRALRAGRRCEGALVERWGVK